MDGYTYENRSGGWQMCNICGVRVSDEEKHTKWHQALTDAIVAVSSGPGTMVFLSWNTPPREATDG